LNPEPKPLLKLQTRALLPQMLRLLLSIALLASSSLHAAKLPKMVRINGNLWAIKLVDLDAFDRADRIGLTECATREILVLKDLSPWDKAEVIVHEVQHAFTCDNNLVHNDRFNNDGVEKHCDSHCGIYFATPKWHQFIRDNPELIRYIHETDPPPIMDQPQSIPQPVIPR
jgi:hypothetical protein